MTATGTASSERLNRECFCLPLARPALAAALQARLGDAADDRASAQLAALTAEQPLFLPAALEQDLERRVRAVGATLLTLGAGGSGDVDAVLGAGVFNSFDFHLTTAGARLIEVNTNAGGAFLQPLLAETLPDCDAGREFAPQRLLLEAFARLAPNRTLRRLAIVDVSPEREPLYLDMCLAAAALRAHGIAVEILDPSLLRREGGALIGPHGPIDMVYNRLTDFELRTPSNAELHAAWRAGEVVLAPNPDVYRALADKRLLIAASDPARVSAVTSAADARLVRETVPHTEVLDAASAARLWSARREHVFKPTGGHGSRGVYRGDKLTRRKWREIVDQDYLAQRFAEPSQRSLALASGPSVAKVDIRVWTHGIEPVFSAARLYTGQVMGFRSDGAGFAPIIWLDDSCAEWQCDPNSGVAP